MLYILFGQDDFSLSQTLEEIKRGIGDQMLLPTNTSTLDGQRVTVDELRAVCETAPFLAERRLVIIKGLLDRFEPPKSRRQKKARTTGEPEQYKPLVGAISNLPESTILVLIGGDIKNGNPLLKELSSRAQVKTFPLMKGASLRQWIQKRLSAEKATISPQAADLLAKLIGGDLWIMASEINKLALFTSGRRIEEEDVRTVVSYAHQSSVFVMVDAIIDAKIGVAEQVLQQLLQKGEAPNGLLAMLARQVEMIVRAKELRKQGKTSAEIQTRLGIQEFALRKTLEQAGRYSTEQLKGLYHQLLEADLSIKTGKYDGELALNILVAELAQR